MTTRLNPITTPRHQLRAEKARRNKDAALAAFLGKKAEIDERLARLQALSDDHFSCHPDEFDWADVGTLEHYRACCAHHRQRLQRGRIRKVIPSGPYPGQPAATAGFTR